MELETMNRSELAIMWHLYGALQARTVFTTTRERIGAATGIKHPSTVTKTMQALRAGRLIRYTVQSTNDGLGRTTGRFYKVSFPKVALQPPWTLLFSQRKVALQPLALKGASFGKVASVSSIFSKEKTAGVSAIAPTPPEPSTETATTNTSEQLNLEQRRALLRGPKA
jgi:hypothetical protein